MRVRPPSRRHPLPRFVGYMDHAVDDGEDCSFETVFDANSSPPPGWLALDRCVISACECGPPEVIFATL